MITRLARNPVAWLTLAVFAAAGLYWFQPWKLVTDTSVSETLSTPAPRGGGPSLATPSADTQAGPALVSMGDFVTHEHDTSGTARIIRAADGSHTLELVDLDTSNGPDLRVWLTDQEVPSGVGGWRVFDDGRWVELGRLKGNRGDQAYAVPADIDPSQFSSVSIWCKRFAVSFGAAPLSTA